MDLEILNQGQVTRTTPELALSYPNYPTTPTGGRLSSPTRWVFRGTELKLVPRSYILTTRIPRPHCMPGRQS
ncbi:hypothetical protein TNCV_1198031 [Trichonephila clavipes]|uniref:Uncharacterized protein n=1 Tax=Trichonephila clavipes TaxID=2585209 RepID=A0A8X6VFD1_TRICX|nr:hypothetical protein TNCV_1198031 [Trichonephila clavipes]